jgi:hypothetical protein
VLVPEGVPSLFAPLWQLTPAGSGFQFLLCLTGLQQLRLKLIVYGKG